MRTESISDVIRVAICVLAEHPANDSEPITPQGKQAVSDEPEQSGGHSGDGEYRSVMPFWIDTPAYSKRDRAMFVAGVEFQMVYDLVKGGWTGERPIHRENESRLRMMCARLKVPCRIVQGDGFEGCEEWSYLTVLERRQT